MAHAMPERFAGRRPDRLTDIPNKGHVCTGTEQLFQMERVLTNSFPE
jgi:hypothetical protein